MISNAPFRTPARPAETFRPLTAFGHFRSLVANKEDTVFGVNYEPVTKACFVKLFLLNSSGTLVFINNVNARAAELLPAPWAESAREFLRIENIVGRHVQLQTVDFSTGARPTHNFSVLVAPDGTVSLP